MNTLLLLMLEFFKTGLFSFGGGLATIPFLKEMSINYNWFSLDFLSTMIAISESTPGAMGINMATYVGYATCGIAGGILATLALVCPSIIITVLIAKAFKKFKDSKTVQYVFSGLRPAAVGLIIAAVIDIFIKVIYNTTSNNFNLIYIIIYIVMCAFYYKYRKIHPALVIGIGALLGILLSL